MQRKQWLCTSCALVFAAVFVLQRYRPREVEIAWNEISRLPLDEALAIDDDAMLAWLEQQKLPPPLALPDPHAWKREFRRQVAERVQREEARRLARLFATWDREQKRRKAENEAVERRAARK